jgi:hypothetical protein
MRLGSREATPKTVTPERFNRGAVRIPPGFPLKTCGNDGLVGELGVEGHTPFSFFVGERKLMNHFVVRCD